MNKLINNKEDWEPYDPLNPDHLDSAKYEIVKKGTVYDHTLRALEVSQMNDPIANLCILFHDIAKAKTQGFKGNGDETYYGHEKAAGELIDEIAQRLKLSNKDKEAIQFVADNHMLGFQVKQGMKKQRILDLRNSPYWEYLKNCFYADIMSRGIPSRINDFNELVDIFDTTQKEMGEKEEYNRKISTLIDGRKIMELIPGISGHDIGRIKTQTVNWIVDNDFNVTKKEVEDYVKELANENEAI